MAKKEPNPNGLSDREYAFVLAMRGEGQFNGSKSAILAGYSPKGARQRAFVLMKRPEIAELVREERLKRNEELSINPTWVLVRYVDLYDEAIAAGDRRIAIQALDKIAEHVDVGAKVKNHRHAGPGGGPIPISTTIDVSNMSLAQLEELEELRRRARSLAGLPPDDEDPEDEEAAG